MSNNLILNMTVEMTREQAKKFLQNNGEKITAAVTRVANGTISQHLKVVGVKAVQNTSLQKIAQLNPATGVITMVSSMGNNIQTAFLQKSVNRLEDITKDLAIKVSGISTKMDVVRNLSWLNTGISMVNLGVSVAGFAYISTQLQAVKKVVMENKDILDQVQNDTKNMIEYNNLVVSKEYNEICMNIVAVSKGIIEEPFNDYKKEDIRKLLNHTASFLDQVIELFNKRIIPGELGCNIIIPLSMAYANLIKIYSTEYYFYSGEREFPPNYNDWMFVFTKLKDDKFKKRIYNHYLVCEHKIFSEEELKTILFQCENMFHSAIIEIEDHRTLAEVFGQLEYSKLVKEKMPEYAKLLEDELITV